MIQNGNHIPPRALWAYGYTLAPPVTRTRLGGIQAVLDAGHSDAALAAEIWEGRFVNGDEITHILIVSDDPAQDLDVNHRLEAELLRIGAGFSRTASLEVVHGPH